MLLDHENKRAGFVSIPDAVLSHRAFAVEPDKDMLALDADTPVAVEHARSLVPVLLDRKLAPVLVSSGGHGRVHLFARVTDTALKSEIEREAKLYGCDPRAHSRIRPPLSPHRLGLPVALFFPASPDEALRSLASKDQTSPNALIRRLSAGMRDLVRRGSGLGPEARYTTRSERDMAIALACANAGLTENDYLRIMLDPQNRAGEKVRELTIKDTNHSRKYIALTFRKALKRATDYPKLSAPTELVTKLQTIRSVAIAQRWKRRAGASDYAMLDANIDISRRARCDEYGASYRYLAEVAGLSDGAAFAAQKRLRERGFIVLAHRGRPGDPDASRWRIKLPAAAPLPEQLLNNGGGVRTDCSSNDGLGADAWRWHGGLGQTKHRIWDLISRPRTAAEISSIMGTSVSTVLRHLRKLRQLGLCCTDAQGRWVRVASDLDKIAEKLGVAGAGERQRDTHRGQRDALEDYLASAQTRPKSTDTELKIEEKVLGGMRVRFDTSSRRKATLSNPHADTRTHLSRRSK